MLLMRVVCKMLMTVLICDGPGSGFQIIGLFANSADAQSYAKDHSLKDWRVAEVISPRAFADSQVGDGFEGTHLRLSSAPVATIREGRHVRRSDRTIQHQRWDRGPRSRCYSRQRSRN